MRTSNPLHDKIYISTGGLKNELPAQSSARLHEMGFNHIELSGGQFSDSTLSELLAQKASGTHFVVHNYFPPPARPFVLNLASNDPEVLKQSREHCKTALSWASQLGSPVYAVHAGFLMDPKPSELGKQIAKRELQDRDQAIETFVASMSELAKFAARKNVKLMVENNVLSPRNLSNFGSNPLLMVDADEIFRLRKLLDPRCGFLLDVAHLKVSAKTLALSLEKEYETIYDFVDSYHLSDNDGTQDSNEAFQENAWFLKNLHPDACTITLEVYQYEQAVLKNLHELVCHYGT